jgi:HSP20 family molecular chaperone IbpA
MFSDQIILTISFHAVILEVLVHPVPQREEREERWQIEEEANRVNLWFEVPGQSKEDLAVEIDEDVLVIKKKTKPVAEEENMNKQNGRRDPKRNDPRQPGSPAAKGATAPDGNVIYARLLLPGGYSKEGVEAELKSGVLRVSLAKVKKEARRKISIEIINVK